MFLLIPICSCSEHRNLARLHLLMFFSFSSWPSLSVPLVWWPSHRDELWIAWPRTNPYWNGADVGCLSTCQLGSQKSGLEVKLLNLIFNFKIRDCCTLARCNLICQSAEFNFYCLFIFDFNRKGNKIQFFQSFPYFYRLIMFSFKYFWQKCVFPQRRETREFIKVHWNFHSFEMSDF